MADLFVAGTETTATTIRWAIMYLLNNMDIQKKMHKEIEDVIGSGRPPCMSDKPNLPYCEAVILESLRLGNVVPYALPHKASDDIVYKGFTIPKDSIILPSLDSVAFDENLFPDAQSFKPERFIDENGRLCGQDKVLSFSLGRLILIKIPFRLFFFFHFCIFNIVMEFNSNLDETYKNLQYEGSSK